MVSKSEIRGIVQKEMNKILGIDSSKMRNIHYLIEAIQTNVTYSQNLESKLQGVTGQIALEQAKIRILEKFIDDSELTEKYQEFLNKMNNDLDNADKVSQP